MKNNDVKHPTIFGTHNEKTQKRNNDIFDKMICVNINIAEFKPTYISIYLCCLIFSEEHKARVFENEVLRKIFGPQRGQIRAEWRILHTAELYHLYSS